MIIIDDLLALLKNMNFWRVITIRTSNKSSFVSKLLIISDENSWAYN